MLAETENTLARMNARRTILPLPVARLRRRSHNAKSSKDRHDTAYFAWEVSLRLAVAAHPPANLAALSRGAVGDWAKALSPADRPLQDARLLELFALLSEVGLGTRSERRSLRPRDLIDALPAYRNKAVGHGSVRDASSHHVSAVSSASSSILA